MDYIKDVVLRTCSGSGTDFEQWVKELEILNEQMDGKASSLALAGIGLGGEAGEITDEVKKLIFHGKPWTQEIKDKLKKELGDVLWYAGVLCYVLDEDFESIMLLNKAKLEARYPNGFTAQASLNKADESLLPNS